MRKRPSSFAIYLAVFALWALMLSNMGLHSAYATPQQQGEVPFGVGIYLEHADPCSPTSVLVSSIGAAVGALVGSIAPVVGTAAGAAGGALVGNGIAYYLALGCNEAVAKNYSKVEQAFRDAYREAEVEKASPGFPDEVGIHEWVGFPIQDFWGGTDRSGAPRGDGWGAIIWGGPDAETLPYFVGGSTWVAYKRAVYEPSVLGNGIIPGYPTGPQHPWNRVQIQDFSGGSWGITAIIGGDQPTAWLVAGNHLQAYIDADGSNTLGNPLGPVEFVDGWYVQKFEGGRILELAGETRVDYHVASDTPTELPAVGHQEPVESVAEDPVPPIQFVAQEVESQAPDAVPGGDSAINVTEAGVGEFAGSTMQTTAEVNMRSGPDIGAPVLFVVASGTQCTVFSRSDSADGRHWYQLDCGFSRTGWVSDKNLKSGSASVSATTSGDFTVNTTVETTASNLKLRSGAGTNNSVLYTLSSGVQCTVLAGPISATGYQWYQVDCGKSRVGWVAGSFLRKT